MLHLSSRRFQNYRTLPTIPSTELNAVWSQEITLHIGIALLITGALIWALGVTLGVL